MRQFVYGAYQINYSLAYAKRKTIAITVKPDMSVWVKAPEAADPNRVEDVLRRRASWVIRQQRYFEQFHPRTPPREYISGETHLYLGRRYRLRIHQNKTLGAYLQSGYLHVSVPEPDDPATIKSCLEAWYRQRALIVFHERLKICHSVPVFKSKPIPRLRVRKLAKRWGSCTSSQVLTLNSDLIRAPRTCIDYVVTHELCHVIYPNHSRAFYDLLTAVMGDWEQRKARLELTLS